MPDITYVLNDPTTPKLMVPVDLPQKPGFMDFKIDGYTGPTSGLWTLEHQAACCYFTTCQCLGHFAQYAPAGARRWAATQRLMVQPRAGKQFNAFYDRQGIRLFGAQDPVTKNFVWASNSREVYAHELGHALLDAVRPDLYHLQAMEVWAFHEGFADIHAILDSLQYDELLNAMIEETGGDLSRSNVVSTLAEEMGTAIYDATGGRAGHTVGALRNAVNAFTYVEPEKLPRKGTNDDLIAEPHSFGRVILGAWYDIFVGVYNTFKAQSNPKDAVLKARDVMLKYTWGAVPLAPATIRFYDGFARAMLVMDKANNYQFNALMNQVFMARHILKETVRPLVNIDWESFKPGIESSDEIFNVGNVAAVRNKKIETISLPTHMLNVEVPCDTLYEFGDGDYLGVVTYSASEIIEHAHECVEMLNDLGLIRPDPYTPFEITPDGKLIRSHFACGCGSGCGCLNNGSIKGAPEFGKSYKPKNNAGCSCFNRGQGTQSLTASSGSTSLNAGSQTTVLNASQPGANVITQPPVAATITSPGMQQDIIISRKLRNPGVPLNITGSASLVTWDAETTITSYVVPAGKTFYTQGFVAEGQADGVYKLYIDGEVALTGRSSVAVPTLQLNFAGGNTPVTEGKVLSLTVTHFADGMGGLHFTGTIIGILQ